MGMLQDLLKDIPLSAVLKERIALAEDKQVRAEEKILELNARILQLEQENGQLRSQLAPTSRPDLPPDTAKVLVHLFRAESDEARDVQHIAVSLRMESGVAKYHLDRLAEQKLADTTGLNYVSGHVYWALTPKGRQVVVERRLLSVP